MSGSLQNGYVESVSEQARKVESSGWVAVRCVYHDPGRDSYEERVTLWRTDDMDEGIRLAEEDAKEYADTLSLKYLDFAQAYLLSDDPSDSGAEVFSLYRDSELRPSKYLDTFFSTGSERQQHWKPKHLLLFHWQLVVSVALAVAAPLLAVWWQWQSITFLVDEPTCGEQMSFDLVGGGYGLVAATALLPTLAAALVPVYSGRKYKVALGVAIVSAVLMAVFWWQLLGLAECAKP